jgi:hypothetical protein
LRSSIWSAEAVLVRPEERRGMVMGKGMGDPQGATHTLGAKAMVGPHGPDHGDILEI